jgi:BlaI family penicillinase repressor
LTSKNNFLRLIMKSSKKDSPASSEPTKSELEILQVLWQYGPSTVRFVNDTLNEQKREVNYMSTQKLMLIMLDKGFLTKDTSQMTHVYQAAAEEDKTKGALLDRVVDNIFNGSASNLMMQLLGNKKMSPKEMEEFKELIKKLDEK